MLSISQIRFRLIDVGCVTHGDSCCEFHPTIHFKGCPFTTNTQPAHQLIGLPAYAPLRGLEWSECERVYGILTGTLISEDAPLI